MPYPPLPSIDIAAIDMQKCYLNAGCALSIHSPDTVQKLLGLLQAHFGPVKLHTTCCRHEPNLPAGSTIINCCAGCDRRFRSLYAGVNTVTLWEVLAGIENLPLPRYEGLILSVQDSCSYRRKPQVHAAVRALLRRMGIAVEDARQSGGQSICCGDHFFRRVSNERAIAFQHMRAAQMPCQQVAAYCVSCVKSLAVGDKTPRHMADLVLGQPTEVGVTDPDIYHAALDKWIDAH